MIKAKFKQKVNGVTYNKGDVIEGLTAEQEADRVRLGSAEVKRVYKPKKKVNDKPVKDIPTE